jgi:hypothetical protein
MQADMRRWISIEKNVFMMHFTDIHREENQHNAHKSVMFENT